jgi:hypothetical protein
MLAELYMGTGAFAQTHALIERAAEQVSLFWVPNSACHLGCQNYTWVCDKDPTSLGMHSPSCKCLNHPGFLSLHACALPVYSWLSACCTVAPCGMFSNRY